MRRALVFRTTSSPATTQAATGEIDAMPDRIAQELEGIIANP